MVGAPAEIMASLLFGAVGTHHLMIALPNVEQPDVGAILSAAKRVGQLFVAAARNS